MDFVSAIVLYGSLVGVSHEEGGEVILLEDVEELRALRRAAGGGRASLLRERMPERGAFHRRYRCGGMRGAAAAGLPHLQASRLGKRRR